VRATLKRICDRVVATNHDISNFDQFLECVSEIIFEIDIIGIETQGEKMDKEIRAMSKLVKGKLDLLRPQYDIASQNTVMG